MYVLFFFKFDFFSYEILYVTIFFLKYFSKIYAPCVSENNVAKFTFAQLCREPRGAADYITLSKAFHTFFLLDVPVLGPDDINPTRRFITLIDALYEARVKLVVSAAEVPEKLLREENSSQSSGEPRGDLIGTDDYVCFIYFFFQI